MRPPWSLLILSYAASISGNDDPAPQPKILDIDYWGSACPKEGLTAVVGPVNAATNTAPLTFTLANLLPSLGSFGSSLRMCSIVSHLAVDQGWKIVVNAGGTSAQGNTNLPANATMYLRSTYSFAERSDIQSVGMLDIRGPLSGQYATHITPESSDQGAPGPCMGGELDIEFQARAVEDLKFVRRAASNETSWTLSTGIVISRC